MGNDHIWYNGVLWMHINVTSDLYTLYSTRSYYYIVYPTSEHSRHNTMSCKICTKLKKYSYRALNLLETHAFVLNLLRHMCLA